MEDDCGIWSLVLETEMGTCFKNLSINDLFVDQRNMHVLRCING